MFTTTRDRLLPTTVTGSWPRPRWFDKSPWGRRLSDAMTDDTSYASSFEIHMERIKADIWTVEMKERGYADLELFKRHKGGHWPKAEDCTINMSVNALEGETRCPR